MGVGDRGLNIFDDQTSREEVRNRSCFSKRKRNGREEERVGGTEGLKGRVIEGGRGELEIQPGKKVLHHNSRSRF